MQAIVLGTDFPSPPNGFIVWGRGQRVRGQTFRAGEMIDQCNGPPHPTLSPGEKRSGEREKANFSSSPYRCLVREQGEKPSAVDRRAVSVMTGASDIATTSRHGQGWKA
jgi:hypothetical protein